MAVTGIAWNPKGGVKEMCTEMEKVLFIRRVCGKTLGEDMREVVGKNENPL